MLLIIKLFKHKKMRTGIFYLNNYGTKWVILENGKKPFEVFSTKSGKLIQRVPNYYFSFGNFGGVCINYKGKKLEILSGTTLED